MQRVKLNKHFMHITYTPVNTLDRWQSRTLILLLTNAPHFHLMQNRRRIRAGYSPNSFF